MPYKDPEKQKEHNRIYHIKNKEKAKLQRQQHKKHINEVRRIWHNNNKEKISAAKKKYRELHKEHISLKKKEAYQKRKLLNPKPIPPEKTPEELALITEQRREKNRCHLPHGSNQPRDTPSTYPIWRSKTSPAIPG